jgi:hypothetical protein
MRPRPHTLARRVAFGYRCLIRPNVATAMRSAMPMRRWSLRDDRSVSLRRCVGGYLGGALSAVSGPNETSQRAPIDRGKSDALLRFPRTEKLWRQRITTDLCRFCPRQRVGPLNAARPPSDRPQPGFDTADKSHTSRWRSQREAVALGHGEQVGGFDVANVRQTGNPLGIVVSALPGGSFGGGPER